MFLETPRSTASVRVDGLRASVALDGRDPAAYLAEALAAPDLPRPRSAEYGALSLADLYRSLSTAFDALVRVLAECRELSVAGRVPVLEFEPVVVPRFASYPRRH